MYGERSHKQLFHSLETFLIHETEDSLFFLLSKGSNGNYRIRIAI